VNRPSSWTKSAVLKPTLVRASRSGASATQIASDLVLSDLAAAAALTGRATPPACDAHTVRPVAGSVATAVSMIAERKSPLS
jgi:hypothetical protein